MDETKVREVAAKITAEFADKGMVLRGGWEIFKMLVVPPGAGPAQLKAMELAYYAGAQHVYSSMLNMMDDSDETSDQDLRRMERLNEELVEWSKKARAGFGI